MVSSPAAVVSISRKIHAGEFPQPLPLRLVHRILAREDGPMGGPRRITRWRRKTVRHWDEPGDAHFLTFSCYRRLPLLSKDRSRHWLLEALAQARQKHEIDLWGWVIMPEHVHLLTWPRTSSYHTWALLADIKRPVGKAAMAWLEVHHPEFLPRLTVFHRHRTYRRFWQAGPGQDHNVHNPATAHKILQYIHDNPVKRGLIGHAEEWLWSSAADWAGRPNIWLRVNRSVPSITDS